MTPEQIEEIKRSNAENAEKLKFNNIPNPIAERMSRHISKLLAALEEAQHQKKTILAGHERDINELYRIENELAEAQQTIAIKQSSIEVLAAQVVDETALHANTEVKLIMAERTIARQRESLEPEQKKSIIDHCSDLNHYDDDNFNPPMCIDELPETDKAEVMEWLYVLLGACAESAVDSVTDALAASAEGETQP